MKIWTLFASILLGAIILGCSTSNDTAQREDFELLPTDYQIILKGTSGIYAQNLVSISKGLSLSNIPNVFPGFTDPLLEFRADSKMLFYDRTNDCEGKVLFYDFEDGSSFEMTVFSDLSSCSLIVTAIAQHSNRVFISYYLDISGKDQAFYVRSIDKSTNTITDFEVNMKPTQLAISNNRLFILTWDENKTDAYALTILNFETNTEVHEMDLGLNVGIIFAKSDGDIVIGYPNEHTTLDSNSLSPIYTRYNSGLEPHFYNAKQIAFDQSGRMYYVPDTNLDSETDGTTAMHDFNLNSTVLYYFKNFLNEEELNVEFDIQTATTVNYDDINNLILIGYKKNKALGGGIIRITPAPSLTFVDNLDLENVPTHIFPD